MSFALGVAALVGIFILASLGAARFERSLGLLSIAHAAVLGTGSYVYAISCERGMSVPASVAFALLLTTGVGVLVAAISERIVGEDFALATFAVQVLWFGIAANYQGLTHGMLGISGIPHVLSSSVATPAVGEAGICAFLILLAGAAWGYIERSPFEMTAAVVRRSGELARTLGFSATLTRAQIGAVYGLLQGFSGVLLGSFLSFIDPTLFSANLSVVVIAIASFARRGVAGVVVGAFMIVAIPQMARLSGASPARASYLQMLFAGAVVCLSSGLLRRRKR